MGVSSSSSENFVQDTIEKFWETIHPIWRQLRSHAHQVASEKYGITGGQFAILRAIHHGKQSVSDLADFGHISRPAISRTVDSLVNGGLVSRLRNPEDRRQIQLALTEEGLDLLRGLSDENHAWMADRLKHLSPEQLVNVSRALDLIHAAFESIELSTNT